MLLAAVALAVELVAATPDGPLRPGEPGRVELVLVGGDGPVPAQGGVVSAEGATLGPVDTAGARTQLTLTPAGAGPVRVRLDLGGSTQTVTLPVGPAPGELLGAPEPVVGAVGADRIELRFPLAMPVDPTELVARVSEGRVLEVRVVERQAVVAVQPGPDRTARQLGVALADLTDPGTAPAFAAVPLRARQSASVDVGAGGTVTVRVGRRAYGPFTAGADGKAELSFEVWPGEASAELLATDDLGNSRKLTTPLPTVTTPTLVGIEVPVPGAPLPELWLGTWTPAGLPWPGADPTCRSGAGGREAPRLVRPGVYRYRAPPVAGAFDVRVECAVEASAGTWRLPTSSGRPARLDLRVYPEALSADFPFAQVQATLTDASGERLPADRVELRARYGVLTSVPADGAVRADLDATAATAAGGDRVEASWRAPPGVGAPWALDLSAASAEGLVDVRVRVRDRRGDPLLSVPVRIDVGPTALNLRTDAAGWARARVDAVGVLRVRAAAGRVEREQIVLPGEAVNLPDPERPDLWAAVELPVRAGQVRQMFIDVRPRPLRTGTGETATVEVRMLDAGGIPVRDEAVVITAASGTVAQARPRADGTFEAVYTPPPGSRSGTVAIRAESGGGSVATELELVPRPVRGSVGFSAGWITNFGAVDTPTGEVVTQTRLPLLPEVLHLRVGVGTYRFSSDVPDQVTGGTVRVRAQFVPVEIGLGAGQRVGRRVLDTGASLVLLPYGLTTEFNGEPGVAGTFLGPPGVLLHGGAGLRFGTSELYGEVRYLLAAARGGSVSFEGSVGGGSLVAGYRVVY